MSKHKVVTAKRLFEGLPVIDAEEDLEISVTKKDIEGSKKKDPGECAAARAGRRELKREVRVFIARTYVKEDDHWVRYLTPHSVAKEIISFDRGSAFEPGEYIIKAPPLTQRLGVYRGKMTKKTTKKNPSHRTQNVRARANY